MSCEPALRVGDRRSDRALVWDSRLLLDAPGDCLRLGRGTPRFWYDRHRMNAKPPTSNTSPNRDSTTASAITVDCAGPLDDRDVELAAAAAHNASMSVRLVPVQHDKERQPHTQDLVGVRDGVTAGDCVFDAVTVVDEALATGGADAEVDMIAVPAAAVDAVS